MACRVIRHRHHAAQISVVESNPDQRTSDRGKIGGGHLTTPGATESPSFRGLPTLPRRLRMLDRSRPGSSASSDCSGSRFNG